MEAAGQQAHPHERGAGEHRHDHEREVLREILLLEIEEAKKGEPRSARRERDEPERAQRVSLGPQRGHASLAGQDRRGIPLRARRPEEAQSSAGAPEPRCRSRPDPRQHAERRREDGCQDTREHSHLEPRLRGLQKGTFPQADKPAGHEKGHHRVHGAAPRRRGSASRTGGALVTERGDLVSHRRGRLLGGRRDPLVVGWVHGAARPLLHVHASVTIFWWTAGPRFWAHPVNWPPGASGA